LFLAEIRMAFIRMPSHIDRMSGTRCDSHKDLVVWQKALALAVEIYFLAERFPRAERFGLVTQMRRAAVSVPSNIAEGSARRTTRDFAAFLHVARGSLAELETQVLLAGQIGYLGEMQLRSTLPKLDEVGRLLTAVIAGLRRRDAASF
jgi:four helix bundle protein